MFAEYRGEDPGGNAKPGENQLNLDLLRFLGAPQTPENARQCPVQCLFSDHDSRCMTFSPIRACRQLLDCAKSLVRWFSGHARLQEKA
jgi:hypothetical protein